VKREDGQFHIIHDGRTIGPHSYASPEGALRDLIGGNLTLPSSGVSAGVVGIPDELSQWGVVLSEGE